MVRKCPSPEAELIRASGAVDIVYHVHTHEKIGLTSVKKEVVKDAKKKKNK